MVDQICLSWDLVSDRVRAHRDDYQTVCRMGSVSILLLIGSLDRLNRRTPSIWYV